MWFPQLKTTPKVLHDGKNTYEKITTYTDKNLVGGESVGIAAASSRPMRELIANKLRIEVGPSVNGKRNVKTFYRGKMTSEKTVSEVYLGKNTFDKSPKEAFVIEPRFGDKQAYDLGFMGQAAVDINGKSDLPDILKDYGGNPSSYVSDLLFTNVKDQGSSFLLKDVTKILQVPYSSKYWTSAVMENLGPYIKTTQSIKNTGGQISVAGEIASFLDGLKPLDFFKGSKETQNKVDAAINQHIRSTYEKEIAGINASAAAGSTPLTRWMEKWKQIKRVRTDTKKLAKEVWKTFKRTENLTSTDKRQIALWAAISPEANLFGGDQLVRPRFLINENAEVAKEFSYAQNNWEEINKGVIKKTEVDERQRELDDWNAENGQGGPTNGTGQWGILRKNVKKHDGQGGVFGDMWSGVKNMFGMGDATYKAPATTTPTTIAPVKPSTYDVRGISVSDDDLKEAANILYGEISNRTPDKQQFEIRHIVNTAINRAKYNPKVFGSTLTQVLQKPMQYQSYAPSGVTLNNKTVESQYQKVQKGLLSIAEKQKLKLITDTLNELKSGKFADTTGDSMFYVHASDGTLWLGKTVKEAKDSANKHERYLNLKKTQWGTAQGAPVQN